MLINLGAFNNEGYYSMKSCIDEHDWIAINDPGADFQCNQCGEKNENSVGQKLRMEAINDLQCSSLCAAVSISYKKGYLMQCDLAQASSDETISSLRCDFCGKDMPADETGIFLLAEEKGGHILCAYMELNELEYGDES